MSGNLDSPVKTQMALSVFKSPVGRNHHGNDTMEGVNLKTTGRRRIFIQTESGCVLGMDLDRNDNAHMVKRRLQIALNVPTEESSLTFGDLILKNDLSAIRNYSPLLLTRNLIHRSSSSPCLSPSGRDIQQRDRSGPIEILGHSSNFTKTKELVKEIAIALKNGIDPIPVHGGLGGAYYFRNINGESVAIVKPTDEEPFAPNNPKGFVGKALGQPGLKRSVRVGETGYREVAAYLLDHNHFANVPPTALVKITHSIFNVNDVSGTRDKNKKKHFSKIASFQQFIAHDYDASDHGTSNFPVSSVHRIGILDIRIFNTDRHAGNLLVRIGGGQFGQVELIPIDHGLCLPENLEDPYFEWIHWPQSSIPFSEDELDYIESLDPFRDSEILKSELPMIREACLRVLILSTVFLKEGARFGLCLAEIGEMMSREFRRGEEEPSELEALCMAARRAVVVEREKNQNQNREPFVLSSSSPKREVQVQFQEDGNHGIVFEIDDISPISPFQFGYGRNPLSKLEEEQEEEEEEEVVLCASGDVHCVSRLLKKNLSLGEHRSASEQAPGSACFVKLGDMKEEEWGMFLEKFQELLGPAFGQRKSGSVGQRLRQRLGTSCQF
ncbi:phosphatidylinositol 4-kinase gamma 7 [Lactuca sativa]|uniref:1-phosphatidylinositol 4-kinase n=1 Tax=Lactuca sativa TaxID=4236 RepID=A0A9R1UP66_LACSA|nr:phosphatidylinositol 4-kinase gamma 7 [Lactuca sativa]KAJ0191011.1 hypothetical protein LSAT_V11C800403730 [Lactuca sativa]